MKPSWCKPRIRKVKWNDEFIKEIMKYATEVLKTMEEKECIKFIRRGNRIENIVVKIECNDWYVKKPIKVNITMSDE